MARPARNENPDAIYHVYSRGNYRAPIFADDGAAQSFLRALEATIRRAGWEVYAYAIMPNHFHLMLRAPRANLSRGMHLLLSAFALRFNGFNEEHGHVFQGRYHAKRVPRGMDSSRVLDYIHLNHVRKGLFTIEECTLSSLNSLSRLLNPERRELMRVGDALEKIAGYPDRADGWNCYLAHLRAVLLEDASGAKYEAEWIAAEKASRLPMVGLVRNEERPLSAPEGDYSHLDADHSEAMFQKLLVGEGKLETDLALGHGLTPWKMRIARGMILDTTASFSWLAKRLRSGSSTYLATVLGEKGGQTTLR
jgi:REP element-mobilizing transposase RayT